MRRWLAPLACAMLIGLLGGCSKKSDSTSTSASGGASSGQHKLRIAVIPKGTTHSYWKSVHAGAEKAAAELGVDIIWKGPLKENDRAGQIQVVQQFITDKVDGIVLAPLDTDALVGPVQSADEAGIPVVIFDSALNAKAGKDYVSLVATDNKHGGELGGQEMVKLLNNSGNIVMLRYQVGSASTDEREAGFLDGIKGGNLKMISDNRYAGATTGEAKTNALNMIDQIRQADGIFTPNESSTLGMLLALRQENLAGKKKFVGFDASEPLVAALQSGEIDALVVQDPTRMGYLAVKTMVDHIHGDKSAPAFIDTGATLVTKDKLSDPAIRKLVGLE